MKIVKHYWFIAIALIAMIKVSLHVKAMRKEDLIFQDYTVRLGGAKWDLKIHTESRFTVTSDSPRGLLQLMA